MPTFGDLGLKFEKQKLVERSRFIQFWNFGLFRVVLHFIWVFSSRSGSFWPVSGCFGSFVVLVSTCVCVCMCVCACVCVCVCVCVHACLFVHPFTLKASYVWFSWNAREQINDVVLKTFLSSTKSLRRYFRMKHQAFLTSHFILFTH